MPWSGNGTIRNKIDTSPKTEMGKNKLTIRYQYLENISLNQVSSYFPIGGHTVNRTLESIFCAV